MHVGHSTGGGEVARYIGRHGNEPCGEGGADRRRSADYGQEREKPGRHADRGVRHRCGPRCWHDRSQFWKDLSLPFYGYNKPGAEVSEGVREVVLAAGQ